MPHFFRTSKSSRAPLRALDVRADDTDARDYIFRPSLDLLPDWIDPHRVAPVLNQLSEGACVGFALATVINVSLARRASTLRPRKKIRPEDWVSPRMLYEMARRYDEWKGETYEGTSLRGGMKGWHKHGVTTERDWPYRIRQNGKWIVDREFTPERAGNASKRPIGAYYRIVDNDLSQMQAAILEGDAVMASAWIHRGWQHENLEKRKNTLKRIPAQEGNLGLHAFAIIGYGPDGFIVQNSWGKGWGSGGYVLLGYDDWFENRQDAWVARPAPETRDSSGKPRVYVSGFAGTVNQRIETAAFGLDLDPRVLPHLINTGDRGRLSSGGQLRTSEDELAAMARRVYMTPVSRDGFRHVVLYAHGGLNSEDFSVRTANRLWKKCQAQDLGAYFFIWETGIDESILGWLRSDDDASGPARFSWGDAWDSIKNGASAVVREAQKLLGKRLSSVARDMFWDEMKGRAKGASTSRGGAALFTRELLQVMQRTPQDKYKLHLVAHSAGSIYLGWLYDQVLRQALPPTQNVTLESIHFMAPAITVDRAQSVFTHNGRPVVPKDRFRVHMLTPDDEQHDSIHIYPSSLLTYVADHLENKSGRVPLLGIRNDFTKHRVTLATPVKATFSTKHGQFDDPDHEVEQLFERLSSTKA